MKFNFPEDKKETPKHLDNLHLFGRMNPYLENIRKEESNRTHSDAANFLKNISRGR